MRLLLFVLVMLWPTLAQAATLFTDDFENHLTPNWDTGACVNVNPGGSPWQDGCGGGTMQFPTLTTSFAHSGTHSLWSHYATLGVQGGTYLERSHTASSEVWMRFYYRTTAFTYMDTIETKQLYNKAVGGTYAVWHNPPGSDRRMAVFLAWPSEHPCASFGGLNSQCRFWPNIKNVSLDDNRLYCIETHIKMGTLGNADGTLELFVDNEQTVGYYNVNVAYGTTTAMNIVTHYAQYGQGDRYIDDLYVGTTRANDCPGAVVDSTPPSQVTGVTVTGTTNTTAAVTIAGATDNLGGSGITAYRYELCAGGSCSNFALWATTGTGLTTSLTGLTLNTSYNLRVNAQDGSGNLGAYSTTVAFTTANVADITRTTLATDTFNRANTSAANLAGNWEAAFTGGTNAQIVSNALSPTVIGSDAVVRYTDTTPNDQWAQVTIGQVTGTDRQNVAVLVRAAAPPSPLTIGCLAFMHADPGFSTWIYTTSPSFAILATDNGITTWGAGDVLRCEAQGTAVRLYRNDIILLSTTQSAVTTGKTGLDLYQSGGSVTAMAVDNFTMGEWGVAAAPVITNAVTDTTGSQLTYGATTPTYVRVQTDTTNEVFGIGTIVNGRYNRAGGQWAYGLTFVCFFAQDVTHTESSIEADHQCDSLTGLTAQPPNIDHGPATGVLRHLGTTPWLTNDSGNAIYLTGISGGYDVATGLHTVPNPSFECLQDHSNSSTPITNDYATAFASMVTDGLNFVRCWNSHFTVWGDQAAFNANTYDRMPFDQLPWTRTSSRVDTASGNSVTVGIYDLSQLYQAYFDRVRARVLATLNAGIVPAVILFPTVELDRDWTALGSPFYTGNNINSINADANANHKVEELYTLAGGATGIAITAYQVTYLKKMIDTLSDIDGFIWELSNEPASTSLTFQNYMADQIMAYEATGGRKIHPILLEAFTDTNANMIANTHSQLVTLAGDVPGAIFTNPPVAAGTKPLFIDSDHFDGGPNAQVSGFPWKAFTRGNMPVLLDGLEIAATKTLLRAQAAQTRTYANKMHLAGMLPVTNGVIIATSYGLKEDCKEYLMFQPIAATDAIDLTSCGGGTSFTVEYLNPVTGVTTTAANVLGGASRNFIAAEMRIVYLKLDATADTTPPTVFGGLPSGVQAVGTTSVTLQVSTSEASTCKYGSTAGVAYASIANTFTTTGSVTHTASLTGLTVGSYTRYVRCQDTAGNPTVTDTVITWSIPAPTDTTPPVLSNPAPTGTLAQGTTSTTISMTSNEPADLKYSTTDVAYASMTSTMTTVDGLHHSATVTGLTNGSSNTYYVRGQDRAPALNVDTTSTLIAFQVAAAVDTTPPVLSGGSPTGTLAAGTTSVTMTVQTSENATCKYSTTAGVVYASMATTFGTTGAQAHSTTVAGLVNGTTYTRYVRCIDGAANANTSDYLITWTIASPPADVTPPVLSGGSPSGSLPAGTTSVLLQVNTNEAATCKYNTVAGRAYTHPSSVTFTTTGNVAHSTTITGLANNTTYTRYVRCRDTTGNVNGTDYVVTWSIAAPVAPDTTPPVRSGGSPSGALPSGTTAVSLQVTTDETATCKYGTVIATAYASIANTFTTTGGTAHSQTIGSLSDGVTYTYYVRCADALGNANTNDYTITWSITAAADATPPIRSGGSPNGVALPAGTTSVSMQLSTNESATCKYGTVIGTAYAAIANTFSSTGGTAHSQTIATANGTTYTYYVRCQDVATNANTDDYTITWSVTNVSPPPDTTPPTLSLGAPTGTLPTTTTSVVLTVTSSEAATCKYGTVIATAYASIASTFTSTGSTTHTQTLAVAANTTYTYYVRCQDGAGNPNLSDYVITWFVAAAPDVTPSTLTNGAPTGTLPAFTTDVILSLTTSENATCKYGVIAATAYAAIANTFGTTGGTAHSQALGGLGAGTYTKYVRCSDASGNANLVDYVITWVIDNAPDITPPLRSTGSPSGILAIGTTSVAMTLTTDEAATCKYGTTAGVVYASIANTFTTTGTTSHSQTMTPLVNGQTYTEYIRCVDGTANANPTDFIITWSVAADVTAPTRSAGLPSGVKVSGTTSVTMSLTTDEAATCKFGVTPGTTYTNLPSTFTTTGGTAHTQTIGGLIDGQVSTYYILCRDPSGNANTTDFVITWSVAVTNDGTAPTAPSNFTCTTFSSSQAFCTFTPGTDAIGVVGNEATIGMDSSGVCTPTLLIDPFWGVTSPQPLVNLTSGATYCVTMKAFDAAGNRSAVSNTSTFTSTTVVDPIPPSNVRQFEPILGGTLYNTVGLTWQPGTDNVAVVSTDLYRCTGEGCATFDVKFSTVQNSFMDTTVAPNTIYRYEAFHVDLAGNVSVAPSTIIRVVTPLSTVGATQGICPCKPKH